MRSPRIYLDQNIVGHLRDHCVDPSKLPDVTWLYSNEHFREISRSGDLSFLEVFKTLKAQEIEIVLDKKRRFTDRAHVHPYSCPHERYEHHMEAVSDLEIDDHPFVSLLARLYGADNRPNVQSIPEEFNSQIRRLLEPIGKWDRNIAGTVEKFCADLDSFVRNELSETRSLESHRKTLGIDKGRIGNPKTDNPIAEIWEMIAADVTDLTADQVFGFDSLDNQEADPWPLCQGIIHCYSTLNFLGFRTDKKIASESAIPRIVSDATHVAHGAFCDVLLSEDARLCSKARAIYKFKNISTHVVQLRFHTRSNQ